MPSCLKSSVDASIVDTTEVYSASSAVWGGPTWPGLVPSEVLSVLYILLSAHLFALVANFDAQWM